MKDSTIISLIFLNYRINLRLQKAFRILMSFYNKTFVICSVNYSFLQLKHLKSFKFLSIPNIFNNQLLILIVIFALLILQAFQQESLFYSDFKQPKAKQAKYIIIIYQLDLNMLKSSKSLSSFQKITSTTVIKSKANIQNYVQPQAELLLQSRIEQDPCFLGLQSQKSKIISKASRSSMQMQNKKEEGTNSLPLSQLILKDNGYDYLFYEKKQNKIQQTYLRNLNEQKKQIQQMIDLISLQIIAAESTQIKYKINILEKEISRLRAQRKSKSPIQHYSEYLGQFQKGRKQRLSGRFLQLPYQDKSSMKTHCDSKTPSLPSAPVTPVSRCKLMLSPKQVRSPDKSHLVKHIKVLNQKIDIIKSSIETISSFNEKYIEQLKQENNTYRKQIQLLNPLLRQNSLRKNNLRSTVGHFNSSASNRKSRDSRRFQQNCSPCNNRNSRKSQMVRLIERTRKQFLQSPRLEYYYRSGD